MVLIFGNTSNKGESYEYFMKAEYELLQNDFKMAEKYYNKALSLSPDSPTILHSLVDLKIYQGKYSDAINYLERNLLLDPNNKDIVYANYLLAMCYYETIENEKKDLEPLLKAKKKFNFILINYPDTDFALDSKFKIVTFFYNYSN